MVFYTFNDERASAYEQHDTAHRLLGSALFRMYGIQKYTLDFGEHGKPYLENYKNIFFNLSHCAGLAVCAVSESEIGVDAELIRPYKGSAAKRLFSESERNYIFEAADANEAFFRVWTLKECLGKAVGTGIFSGLKNYEFFFSDDLPSCKMCPEKIFTQRIIMNKWVVSVCSQMRESEFYEIVF